ncbi:MAG: glycerophosphodiester phosphodiesterase family protein [Melioribacteraceae bacterium]|nr:glycerophosphodiester phosphodiesterase family protein [Melioribacteraceae bacterium]
MKILLSVILLTLNLLPNTKSDSKEFLIVGHRGAAGHAPENTLESIEIALELGSNAIEIDLRQTSDGIPVALHDADVNRTTDGRGNISNFSFDDLQKLDAGSWFGDRFSGSKVPSLEEIIKMMADTNYSNTSLLIIEFKGGLGEYKKIEEKTLELLEKNNFTNRVILKSFDPNQLEKIRTLDESIPLLYVYAVRIPWLSMIIDTGISFGSVFDVEAEYLQPHKLFLSESFIYKDGANEKQKGHRVGS